MRMLEEGLKHVTELVERVSTPLCPYARPMRFPLLRCGMVVSAYALAMRCGNDIAYSAMGLLCDIRYSANV
eukprot:3420250-Rhodomonas_salina.1